MITVTLPWIDTILLPNEHDGIIEYGTRAGKYSVAEARDRAKNDAYYLTLQAAFGLDELCADEDVNLSIVYNPPPSSRPDNDGVHRALKSALDGIALALKVNDYHFNPVHIYRGAHMDVGRVTITIDDLPF